MPRTDQAPNLDGRAAIHDDIEAGGLNPFSGLIAANLKLHPNGINTFLTGEGDGFISDLNRTADVAEDINHLKVIRNFSEIVIDFFAMDEAIVFARVHRDHPVAAVLQEFHHPVAGTVRLWTGPDHSDGFNAFENTGDVIV